MVAEERHRNGLTGVTKLNGWAGPQIIEENRESECRKKSTEWGTVSVYAEEKRGKEDMTKRGEDKRTQKKKREKEA